MMLLILGFIIAGPVTALQLRGPGGFVRSNNWLGGALLIASIPMFVFALRQTRKRPLRLHHTELPETLPDDPLELRRAIREIAGRIATESPDEPAAVGQLVPLVAAIYRRLRTLEPIDQAAIRVAAHLALQKARSLQRLASALVWLSPATMLLLGLAVLLLPIGTMSQAEVLILAVIFGQMLAVRLTQNWIRAGGLQRELAADRQVLAAVEDPGRFQDALRTLEHTTREAGGTRAATNLAARVRQLEQLIAA